MYRVIVHWKEGRATRNGPSIVRVWAVTDDNGTVVSVHTTRKAARAEAEALNKGA